MRCITAAAALLWPAAAWAATATLKPWAAVHGPNILASDVVQEELPKEAGATVLKPLGRPGSRATVGADLLKAKLARRPGGPWEVKGLACEVSATAQTVLGKDIAAFARAYLEERLAPLSGAARVELKAGPTPPDLLLSGAALRMKVDGQARGAYRGNVILRVRLLQEGRQGDEREAASVPVSFSVSQRQAVLVAARTLRRGELLEGAALELKEADLSYVQGEPLTDLAELAGKRARTQILAGKPLTRDMVEQPPAVRRGDIVRLVSRVGSVSVETSAKALRDAALGESLPVEVEGSKKQVQGRAVEPGVVVREGN